MITMRSRFPDQPCLAISGEMYSRCLCAMRCRHGRGIKMENFLRRLVGAIAFSMILGAASAAAGPNPGEAVYKSKCAVCHGPDGAGKTVMGEKLKARDLRSAEVQKETDAELAQIITKGKEKMPSYAGKLTKEQIGQLVSYIRELAKKK